MPLACDFFQTFFKLNISRNPWVLRDGVAYYLIHECGIHDPDKYLLSGIDIEAIHSEIALRLSEVARDENSIQRLIYVKPYIQLIFLFATTLSEIANGPVSPSHVELAQFLSPDDVIVTFNWDTLMERALMETKHWRVDDGYGVTPHSVFRDGWEKPALPSSQSSFRILKLHGSTSWLTAYPIYEGQDLVLTHALPVDSLFVYEHATRPYPTFAGRYMAGYVPLTYGYYPPNLTDIPARSAPAGYKIARIRPKFPWMPEGEADESGLPSIPLLIPPVREKSYQFFGSLFENLWQQAEHVLQICDELIIIGYSFPRTDLRSHALFTRAFMQRTSIPHVTIIDPNPERLIQKFMMDLGVPDSKLCVVSGPFLGAESLSERRVG